MKNVDKLWSFTRWLMAVLLFESSYGGYEYILYILGSYNELKVFGLALVTALGWLAITHNKYENK